MKTIGFNKKIDNKIIRNTFIRNNDLFTENIEENEREKIINYLECCFAIFSIPLSVNDEEGNHIGGWQLISDGEWIWPSHFSYFIKHKKVNNIDKDFLLHIRSKNFKIDKFNKLNKDNISLFVRDHLLNYKKRK